MTQLSLPHWNLDQLYSLNNSAMEEDLKQIDALIERFSAWKPRLAEKTPSSDDFKKLVADLEDLTKKAHLISGFASLNFAQNTQDQKALSLLGKIDEKMADLSNDLLFFEIWWKDLPEEEAAVLQAVAPEFSCWLLRIRALKAHTLTEAQERIINLKNITGHEALITLYDSITNRYRFSTAFDPEAEKGEVSREELSVYLRSHDPAIRAGAYQELYRVYGHDGPILGQIYQTGVRDWRIENVRLRHYDAPMSVRHKSNDLKPETIEALLKVCRENAGLFREFFTLKAETLGLLEFRRYDLYAPLRKETAVFDFQGGVKEVMAAFESFSPEFKQLANNIIAQKRFSARPMAGKQSGAFCASLTPADTPWVLMSYNGRRQDLFTMAHELGHGIHSQLAAKHHVFHFHATLPLAETASTFGEMLLARRLLKATSNPSEKADLLFHLLDDAYATVGRQAFFAMFEIKAHKMIEAGATVDELAETYYANLTEQFGEKISVSPEFSWEWVSIPHIYHTPFYVYAYSFGQLLVYSLWRLYERDGQAFVPRLTALLARGGSDSPEKILHDSGLGPLDENFWRGGFEAIAGFLDELRAALK